MRERTKISIRRACRLAGVSRTVLGYEPKPNAENEGLTARMIELAHERRRFGYRRLHVLLRREGVHANHKRVQRLYRLAELTVRRRRKRERVAIKRKPLVLPSRPNEVWSMDFVMDRLDDGRRLKALTIVDDFTKESVEIALDHGMSSHYVVRILEDIVRFRGRPGAIRTDQGPEFTRPGTRSMGLPQRRNAQAHPARQAHPERLHRVVQRQVPRRVPERALVLDPC